MDAFPCVPLLQERQDTRSTGRSPCGVYPTRPAVFLRLQAKHRRMMRLQHFSIPEVHMHAARQAWVETAHGTHDVDTLEFIGSVLFEDRRILNRIFVRPRRSVDIPWVRIPGSWRVGMIIRYFVISNHYVM